MNFLNSIVLRRKRYKDVLTRRNKEKQGRLKVSADSLQTPDFLKNDKESIMGVSNNFCFQNPIVNFGLFDNDEPVRIQALRIKGKTQKLTPDEVKQLQRYYYMQDVQQDKDDRFILGEGYKIGKRLLGLNGRSAQVLTN